MKKINYKPGYTQHLQSHGTASFLFHHLLKKAVPVVLALTAGSTTALASDAAATAPTVIKGASCPNLQ